MVANHFLVCIFNRRVDHVLRQMLFLEGGALSSS